ncbi:unnamed protein product [Moneuplotes crassus]|uniref:DUF4378 domain-containing protein n=1 Tax=Euplotes crassus TaxID=5936 RepID=A0AAD1UQZ6_EUPCR|nr:unnamed protein product [Moneuplotes crassus]
MKILACCQASSKAKGSSEGSFQFEKLTILDRESLGTDSLGSTSHQGFWKTLKKEIFQKICKEQISFLNLHSPGKNKKFNEPTISSIRKAKAAPVTTESSLSSRSISKDKKPGSLPKRVKLTGRCTAKNKSIYEDEVSSKPKQAWRKKKSLPGLKKYSSNSQKSFNSTEVKSHSVSLSASRNEQKKKQQTKVVTPTMKKTRMSREMKTPSFGNNSGQDDPNSLYKDTLRREKGMEISAATERKDQEQDEPCKEIDISRLKKSTMPSLEKNSFGAIESSIANEESLIQYASIMGHKKRIQGIKKRSLCNSKNISNHFIKPRSSIRNQQKLVSEANSKTFEDNRNFEQFETSKLPKINFEERGLPQNHSAERIDRAKAQATAEYSAEKDRYIRYELASHSSKRDSCPNSMSDSVKGKKEDYDYYIDRPFNSIDESNKLNKTNTPSFHSENSIKVKKMIGNEIIRDAVSSTGKLQKKLTLKKGNCRKAKISAMISKEYKEDLVQGFDVARNRIGQSNSFEVKHRNLQSLNDSSKEIHSLRGLPSQDKRSRHSRSSKNGLARKDILGSTYEKQSMILIQNSQGMGLHASDMRNINAYTNQKCRKSEIKGYYKKQPKYFKNMNMPASLPSHQTSVQPWPSKRYSATQESNTSSKEDVHRASSELLNSEELRCSSGVAVSYNDNNLLEKELENAESNKVQQRIMNNKYNTTSNDGLTHLMLTAEDRVRVKKYDPKEAFVPVYKDRIEEDKDEDNYTSNFDSPSYQKGMVKSAVMLPGKVLDKIMGYYGDRRIMNSLCRGIKHKLKIHNDIETQKIEFPKILSESSDNQENEIFKISKSLRADYDSEWCRNDWESLVNAIQNSELSPKDLIVLNLYFTFMGIDLSFENLQAELLRALEETRGRWYSEFDPDIKFTFNDNNVEKIRELLIGLNHENFVSSEVSQLGIFDVFTNIIIEALQFLEFIPG